MRRFVSLLTACALMLTLIVPAAASETLGAELFVRETVLHEGATLHENTFWSDTMSDLRRENYIVYAPNGRVRPVVTNGGYVTAKQTVSAAAASLEAQGLRVVAGINGDYYGVANGVPLGAVMMNGVLQNASGENYAVGFRDDGTAVLGAPKISFTVTSPRGEEIRVSALNQVRYSYGGVYLYTHGFNSRNSTGTTEPGYDVVCALQGRLAPGEEVRLTVTRVLSEATDTVLAEGEAVLTANLNAGEAALSALSSLAVGDVLTLKVGAAGEEWYGVTQMLGALYELVREGEVVQGLEAGAAPRTAIGQRADGSLVFYTVDGRKSGHSVGASLTQVAERLVELGCVTALSLDGGGSTTVCVTAPDTTAARVHNVPSDGVERAVTNHVFLVSNAKRSGQVDHIYLRAENERALPRGKVALRAAAIDTMYLPMDAAVTLTSDGGSIEGNVLTLPESGTVTVTGEYGYKTAQTAVTVVETPDEIRLFHDGRAVTELTLSPNDELSLEAVAYWNHLPIAGGSECFEWTLTQELGSIEGGILRAAKRAGAGELTVSVGETVLTVPVLLTTEPNELLDDCESVPTAPLTRSTERAFVRSGKASYRLDYALSEGETLEIPFALTAKKTGYLNVWVYGDAQRAQLQFVGAGDAVTLDFDGWQHLTLPFDGALTALRLTSELGAAGTLYFDTFTATPRIDVDEESPELTLAIAEDGTLTGRAFDETDGASLASLTLTRDGQPLPFTHDSATGALTAMLGAGDTLPHRVTLTAADQSGNLSRTSLDIPALEGGEAPFTDTVGHWSEPYVAAVKARGITNGDGAGHYLPNANLTREEFAAMLCRFLAPAEDYSAVELPFADSGDISPWAADSVRAMLALGVTKGSTGLDGKLYFYPKEGITREEAVTMLGRLLPCGYRVAPAAFTDSADIAAWSREHVELLSGIGVLSGFDDGSFRPREKITRAQIASVFYKWQ